MGAHGFFWGLLSAGMPEDAEPFLHGTAASHFVTQHKDLVMALIFHHLYPVIFEPEVPLEWTSVQGQSFPHLSSTSFPLGKSPIYLHSPNLLPILLFEPCRVLDMYTPVTLRVSP